MDRRTWMVSFGAASLGAWIPGSQLAASVGCLGSETFRLQDGRQLSLATYGDPNGWPVLYFHGIPTSHHEARFFADAAFRNQCHLIAVDRPGYGRSSFQCERRVVDWSRDLYELIDSPKFRNRYRLDQFSVACFSSGSAYALLAAATVSPERLLSVGIVDGIAPLEKIRGCGGVSEIVFRLADRHPQLVRNILDMNTRQMKRNPNGVLRRISRFFSPCDHSVFFQPCNAEILVDSYLECTRCGPAGVAHDMALLARPWGFCIESIKQPVGLWYGACDVTTPGHSMGTCLQRALANSELTVVSEQGHLSMLNWAGDSLFQFLRSHGA